MDDGFYVITYVGEAGMGLCVLLFERGAFRGFDMRGGQYDGTYTRAGDGSVDMMGNLVVMPGVELVTGMEPPDTRILMPLSARLPADLSETAAIPVSVGDRKVEASFRRMRDA
jgi:hypothetical protein